jgi:hypothetical protein
LPRKTTAGVVVKEADLNVVMSDEVDQYGSLFTNDTERHAMGSSKGLEVKGHTTLKERRRELEKEVTNLQNMADLIQDKYLKLKTMHRELKEGVEK